MQIECVFCSPRHFLGILIVLLTVACSDDFAHQEAKNNRDKNLCQFQQGACIQTIDKNTISLSFTPKFAPSEVPIQVKINTSQVVNNLSMRLEGRDMFMGIIPVTLSQKNNYEYNASIIYGSCSSGYMVWRAFIHYEKDGQDYNLHFDFLADNIEQGST